MLCQTSRAVRLSRATVAAIAAGSCAVAVAGAHASTLSYSGGTYAQTFDSLPNPGATSVNTANPVTINGTTYSLQSPTFDFANPIDGSAAGNTSSGGGLGLSATMAGWYGGAAISTKLGATDGDQTTGGDLSFGPAGSSNRSLGLIATSTTGATYFGLDLVNNTAAPITSINLAFTGEQWKQGTTQKTLSVGYTVDDGNLLNLISAATSANYVQLAAVTNPTVGTVGPLDGTAAANQTPEAFTNLSLSTPLTVGGSLWITGQIASAAGGGQGYGIDNLTFASGTAAVPEPTAVSLAAATAGGLLARRRRAVGRR